MSMMPYDYGIEAFYTSNSTQMTFRSCARKLEFRKLYPALPRSEDSFPAAVGKALHTGHQNWMETQDENSAFFAMLMDYPFANLDADTNKARTPEACYATLNEMINTKVMDGYEIAKIQKPSGEIVPAIEVPFEILLEGISLSSRKHIPIIYRGKIDYLFYSRFTDTYAAFDLKTHRNVRKDLTAVYRFDEQVLPYAIVLQQLLNRRFTTLECNYLSVYVDLSKPTVTNYQFNRTEDEVQDWARGLLVDLQQMQMYYDIAWFKKHPNACANNYGSVCQFFDYCFARDPAMIRKLLTIGEDASKLAFTPDYFGEPWIRFSIDMRDGS